MQGKGLLKKKTSPNKSWELLNLRINQLGILIGLQTEHCHLKGRLFKLSLVNSPKCNTCKQVSETASHILYDSETLTTIRFRHLEVFFCNQGTLKTSPSSRYCTFFKEQDCQMNGLKIDNSRNAWVTQCPSFCILVLFSGHFHIKWKVMILESTLEIPHIVPQNEKKILRITK